VRIKSLKVRAWNMLKEIEKAKFMVSDEGRPEAVKKQHSLGKLTARERISLLCDPGSFVEFGMLAEPPVAETEAMRGIKAPADGVVVGIGRINGRPAAISAQDYTVLGGSMGTTGGEKWNRCFTLALQHGFPAIMLADGGGHRIQEGLDGRHFASGGVRDFFWLQARMSGWAIMVTAIMGPGFAGPSNVAAMSDFIPIVKGKGTMGIAGPEIVKAALGYDLSKEEIGGSTFHTEVTGMADIEVETEEECIEAIKRFLSYFPLNAREDPPIVKIDDPWDRRDESLLHLVPESRNKMYDMRKAIEAIADKGSLFELKPKFARNILTILGRMNGRPVGFVANQPYFLAGTIDVKAVDKAARFISMCDAFNLPLIFFIDTPGFLPGPESERAGLVKHSGKLLYEIGMSTVPKISVITRKAYGLGYFAMCGGRTFNADYVVGWPTSEYCAMGIEGAVNIVYRKEIESAPFPEEKRKELFEYFRSRIGALAGASGFGIDDIIDPRDTRPKIIQMLETMAKKKHEFMPPKKHGIVPI
jgi:propionyl-CoA carboxylase beta chain